MPCEYLSGTGQNGETANRKPQQAETGYPQRLHAAAAEDAETHKKVPVSSPPAHHIKSAEAQVPAESLEKPAQPATGAAGLIVGNGIDLSPYGHVPTLRHQ